MFSIHWEQKTKAFRWSAKVLHDLDLQPIPWKFLTFPPSILFQVTLPTTLPPTSSTMHCSLCL